MFINCNIYTVISQKLKIKRIEKFCFNRSKNIGEIEYE